MPDITVTVSDHFVNSLNFLKENNDISNISEDPDNLTATTYIQSKISEMCSDLCNQAKVVKNIKIQRTMTGLSTEQQITVLESMNLPTGSAYI